MVSRKKLKGKARKKAAKTEAAAAGGRDLTLSLSTQIRRPRECSHGWDVTEYPVDHDCHKFIEEVVRIFDECKESEGITGLAVDKAVSFTRDIFPDVWYDSACLDWISSAFVTIGTDAIINEEVFICAAAMGFSESLNQHVACYHMPGSQPLLYVAKIIDLIWAEERRTISYLKKRIPCKCLNEKYKAVKSLPKMYTCCNKTCSLPHRSVNLSAMMTCGGCRREHYCSEECQAAHWEDHRYACNQWRNWSAENCSK